GSCRGARGGGHRRGGVLRQAVPGDHPYDAAHPHRGRALRGRLHLHGHERHLPAHTRWPLQLHPRAGEPGLPGRRARRRRRSRRRHRHLPAASVAGAGGVYAAHVAAGGGAVVARRSARRLTVMVGHRILILCFITFAVFPFYWMVVTTFKQNADLYVGATNTAHNPFLFNRPPTLEHLATLFGQTLYPTWLFNTLFVGLIVVGITLVLAVPGGYSLARLTGAWGERLSIGIFLTYLVRAPLLVILSSRLIAMLGLQNSTWSLVLIYPTFTVPFCTWLLMGFFKSLPKEVEESAMVDGCGRVGAIWRMVLSLSIPCLLAVVIFALTLVIQEFVSSLTFISSVEKMTVSVGVPVARLRGDVDYWGSLLAAPLVTSRS